VSRFRGTPIAWTTFIDVDRASNQKRQQPEQAVDGLADRLDAASAERVIRRAIELHDSDQDDTYDLGLIGKVAAEMEIPPEYVAAALAEELQVSPNDPPRLIERLFVEDRIAVTRVASDPISEVSNRTKLWMSRHEGLRVASTSEAGLQWAKNPSPMVAVRTGLKMQRGTGALRTARDVTTDFRSLGDSTAVTVSADARMARAGAIAGATAGSVGLAVLNGVLWADLLSVQYALAVLIGVLISFVAAAAITKAWASGVRTGLDRAATGIIEPDELEQYETVPDMLLRFRQEWKQMRRDSKR